MGIPDPDAIPEAALGFAQPHPVLVKALDALV